MSERAFGVEQIPFAETREYVGRVLDAQADYRKKYRRELGL
jgi:soluble lytic murein transglycosylase-like protein